MHTNNPKLMFGNVFDDILWLLTEYLLTKHLDDFNL